MQYIPFQYDFLRHLNLDSVWIGGRYYKLRSVRRSPWQQLLSTRPPPRHHPVIPTPPNMPTAQVSYWETKPAIHIKFWSVNFIRKRSLKYNLLIGLWAGTTILTSTKYFESSGPICVIFRIVYKSIRIMAFLSNIIKPDGHTHLKTNV